MKGGRESGPEMIPIWINSRWQIAADEDKALLIKSDAAPQPVGVRRGAGHDVIWVSY
jgi:hypothetical protein